MPSKAYIAAAVVAAMTLAAHTLSAADAQLLLLVDQLRGRTARLHFDTGGLFGDAANYKALDAHVRAMHDSVESLFKTARSDDAHHDHLDKDLAALGHYRVQFSKEFDVLEQELKALWRGGFVGSFVEEDARIVRFRLATIERLEMAIDRHLHADTSGALPALPSLPDLSSRPGGICPPGGSGIPTLPECPLPVDPRPVDPRPIDPVPVPRPDVGGLGSAPIPDGVLPLPRIPGRLDPGRGIPGLDLGRRIPLPSGSGGGGGGSGTGGGSGRPRIPGLGDSLLPGVRDSILRDAIGSRPGTGGGTGSRPGTGRTLIPGGSLLPGAAGGIGIPLPGR